MLLQLPSWRRYLFVAIASLLAFEVEAEPNPNASQPPVASPQAANASHATVTEDSLNASEWPDEPEQPPDLELTVELARLNGLLARMFSTMRDQPSQRITEIEIQTRVNTERITDGSRQVDRFGMIAVLIVAGIGYLGIRNARNLARQEAANWLEERSQDLEAKHQKTIKNLEENFRSSLESVGRELLERNISQTADDLRTAGEMEIQRLRRRFDAEVVEAGKNEVIAAARGARDEVAPESDVVSGSRRARLQVIEAHGGAPQIDLARSTIGEADKANEPELVERYDFEELSNLLASAERKPEAERSLADWRALGIRASSEGDYEGALQIYRSARSKPGLSALESLRTSLWEISALSDVNPSKSIGLFDGLISEYGRSSDHEIATEVARALFFKGVTLGQLDRSDEEIDVYDEVVTRFGSDSDLPLRELVAKVLVNKGVTLGQLDRSDEEIGVYDEVVTRFGSDSDLPLREQVGKALVNKGVTLGKLDRNHEAIDVCDEVVTRFGSDSHPPLREQAARALISKGIALGELDRSDEEIGVYDEVVTRFGSDSHPPLRELVARALFFKGVTLGQLERKELEQAAYQQIVDVYSDDSDPKIIRIVTRARLRLNHDS